MEHAFNIEGKVIIVTGAAGNLGIGYVTSLVAAGAVVYAWDKNEERLTSVLAPSSQCIPMAIDLTDESAVQAAVASIVASHGRIDGVVNNAAMNPAVGVDDGTDLFAPYESYSIELFRKEMDANVVSMMIVMKAVAPTMIAQKRGVFVNIASEVAVVAHDHRVYATPNKYKSPGYAASKAAVVGLTRQWAARLGEHNVRVNAVSIGGVQFPTIPADFAERFGNMNMLMRMARPDEYNATIQYLLSDASSFMTAANIVIDGGKSAW